MDDVHGPGSEPQEHQPRWVPREMAEISELMGIFSYYGQFTARIGHEHQRFQLWTNYLFDLLPFRRIAFGAYFQESRT